MIPYGLQVPVWSCMTPSWGPMVAILDLAGGELFQAKQPCRQWREPLAPQKIYLQFSLPQKIYLQGLHHIYFRHFPTGFKMHQYK